MDDVYLSPYIRLCGLNIVNNLLYLYVYILVSEYTLERGSRSSSAIEMFGLRLVLHIHPEFRLCLHLIPLLSLLSGIL